MSFHPRTAEWSKDRLPPCPDLTEGVGEGRWRVEAGDRQRGHPSSAKRPWRHSNRKVIFAKLTAAPPLHALDLEGDGAVGTGEASPPPAASLYKYWFWGIQGPPLFQKLGIIGQGKEASRKLYLQGADMLGEKG